MCRGGRAIHIPSNKYREWHRNASSQLASILRPANQPERTRIHIKLFAPDNRKGDLTNKAESIMDLLVDNQFLVDDNWFAVPQVTLEFGGVDKQNPRAEVTINEQ